MQSAFEQAGILFQDEDAGAGLACGWRSSLSEASFDFTKRSQNYSLEGYLVGIRVPYGAEQTIQNHRPCTRYWGRFLLPHTGIRYNLDFMIRSFGDGRTQALFQDEFVRDFQGIARPAKRRLEAINAAHRLDDLLVPSSNRMEKLKENLKGFFSIRINDQWRVIFKWIDGDAYEVRVVDYH